MLLQEFFELLFVDPTTRVRVELRHDGVDVFFREPLDILLLPSRFLDVVQDPPELFPIDHTVLIDIDRLKDVLGKVRGRKF